MRDRMQRLRRGAVTGVGIAAAAIVLAGCSGNDNKQNSLHPAGPAAHKILNLCRLGLNIWLFWFK